MENKLTEQEQFKYCEDTKNLKNNLEVGFIQIAKRLHAIKYGKLYESQYGTWSLYLDDIKMHQSKAEQLIRIYEKFIVEYKIKEQVLAEAGGWSVLVRLLPLAKTQQLAQEALQQATLLPNRVTLTNYVKEALEDDFKTCACEDTYEIKICRTCGERTKIN